MVVQTDYAFLFIGGAHQVFHLAPVAAELSRSEPLARVACLYPDAATGAALEQVRTAMDAPRLRLTCVPPPAWAEQLARVLGRADVRKLPLLGRLSWRLRGTRAVVTPERTSSALRWLGLTRPLLINFFHGGGDRAVGSDARLKDFDLVVVPGAKDVARARGGRGLSRDRVRDCGYIKLDYLRRSATTPLRLFSGYRPVVLYNPHFDAAVSSLPDARAVIAAFAAQDRYDLIVAPHLRLASAMGIAEKGAWAALAVPGRIIVDLESSRLIDMSYVRAADIYLGDVSSQLYEFLALPRPVAFLDSHGVDWRGNPHYAGWHLGEVARHPAEVIAAIDRAVAGHPARIELQRRAVDEAFGDPDGAAARGAAIIAAAAPLARQPTRMLT